MKGWINIYRSGFWHKAGKVGAFDLHGGDVYLDRASAVASIDPPSHYVDTVEVDFRDPHALPERRERKMSDRYNGWTNYETWNAKLWIDNDPGSQGFWAERADEVRAKSDDKDDQHRALATLLELHFDEQATEFTKGESSFFTDIFNAALREVDWREVAESILDDTAE